MLVTKTLAYLAASFQDAVDYLDLSVNVSEQAQDIVGQWISKCVRTFVYTVSNLDTDNRLSALEQFDQILEDARGVFEAHKISNLSGERWIMNVTAHQFKVS